MSGHKRATVRLSRQDLQRIEQLASQLRQVEYDYKKVQDKIEENRQRTFQQFNNNVQDRLENFEAQLGVYHNQIGEIEFQTNQALIEQAESLHVQIFDNQELWHEHTNTIIDGYLRNIGYCIQVNQQEFSDYYNALRRELSQFHNENERRYQLAFESCQDAHTLLESIDQVYDHDRFFPGALNRLELQAELADQNLQDGMLDASLVTAQQAIQGASLLRLSIEENLQKTALIQAVAIEKMRDLDASVDMNAVVNAIDLVGEELDIELDVDFWTSGRWQALKNRSEKFLNQLENSSDSMDYVDIERIIKFVIPQIERSLQDLVTQARMKVILSQIRFNIAECVIDSLAHHGFEAQRAIYQDSDERQPYQVLLQNLDGSEVHVHIDSDEPVGSYTVQVDSVVAFSGTESEQYQRAIEIFSSLRARGLRVSAPVEQSTPGLNTPTTRKKYAQNPLQLAY